MVFSDPVFLFFFLPALLAVYWAGGWRVRNPLVVVTGAVFYTWGGGSFLLLLASSIIVNHVAARAIAIWRTTRPVAALWTKRLVVAADLAALVVWKYAAFFAEQSRSILGTVGVKVDWDVSLALPIAISFFTFQAISYVVDVARGTADPAPTLIDYAAYILLFPHLIAGPIVRWADIEGDLLSPSRNRLDDFALGAPRFFWGLAKKILIADQVGAIADAVFGLPPDRLSFTASWLGVLAFAVQIYFDFSGYSDMAIGLARMLGFHFPPNFDHPYAAVSVTDFWRRWHISLSTWFRDYLYIPLGGNRNGSGRTYTNLSIVFLATGFWHGAQWTFVIWGLFHGAFLVLERATGLSGLDGQRWVAQRRAVTFVVVCAGWVFFRAVDLPQAGRMLSKMFSPAGLDLPVTLDAVVTTQRLLWLTVGLLVVLLPRKLTVGSYLSDRTSGRAVSIRLAVVVAIAPVATIYALSSSFSPFLYFKF